MSGSNTLLQPGVSIKPKTNTSDVERIIREVYGLQIASIKELNSYDDNNYHVKVTNCIDNKHVNEDGYVLKIFNSLDSKQPQMFEAQTEILLHLINNGIRVSQPVKDKNGDYYSTQEFQSGSHIIRVLEFISGSILHQVPPSDNLFYQTGVFSARLDQALKKFHHPVYDNRKTVWMMDSVPQLKDFLFAVTDEKRKKLVLEVTEEFSKRVSTVSEKLEKVMIHGDFNEQNIVVEKVDDCNWGVKAILDFGDCSYGCYLYEVAITMMYMMVQGKSIAVGGHVLAGYNSIRKLPPEELNLLKVCVAGRLCQSLVIGAYSSLQDPDNSYILTTAKYGWLLLEELWPQPEDKLLDYWMSIAKTWEC